MGGCEACKQLYSLDERLTMMCVQGENMRAQHYNVRVRLQGA